MADRRKPFHFKEERYSGHAIASLVLGALSAVTFIALTGLSVMKVGEGAMWVGAAGIIGFAFSLAGVITGMSSFKEQSRSYTMSKVGTVFSGLMFAVWFLIFCFGLAA